MEECGLSTLNLRGIYVISVCLLECLYVRSIAHEPLDWITWITWITWSSHAKRATCVAMLCGSWALQVLKSPGRSPYSYYLLSYLTPKECLRISVLKGLCRRFTELEDSLVSGPWFSVYLWNQWFSLKYMENPYYNVSNQHVNPYYNVSNQHVNPFLLLILHLKGL